MSRPLAISFALRAGLAFALATVLASSIIATYDYHRIHAENRRSIEAIGRGVQESLALALFNFDQATIDRIGSGLIQHGEIAGVAIYDTEFNTFRHEAMRNETTHLPLLFSGSGELVFDLAFDDASKIGELIVFPSLAHLERGFLRSMQYLLIANLVAILLAAAFMALLVSRQVVRPISALSRLAVAYEDGSRREPAELVSDTAELENLQLALHSMASSLRRHNENLEELVAERTRALEESRNKLLEAEKMASLGSLVAGVAHEVNTPIGAAVTINSAAWDKLKAFTGALEANAVKRSDFERYLKDADLAYGMLHGNLERASNLIASFKQVSVDQSVEDIRRINLADYTASILASLHGQTRQKLRIATDIPANITLTTQPGALWQVMSNLILNAALHAYDDSGPLDIRARRRKGAVAITLGDRGKGIAPENLRRIWEPFFTTKRGKGGSGLGLSIVYNVVRTKLKGTISVTSTHGEGTLFTIELPSRIEEKDQENEGAPTPNARVA